MHLVSVGNCPYIASGLSSHKYWFLAVVLFVTSCKFYYYCYQDIFIFIGQRNIIDLVTAGDDCITIWPVTQVETMVPVVLRIYNMPVGLEWPENLYPRYHSLLVRCLPLFITKQVQRIVKGDIQYHKDNYGK